MGTETLASGRRGREAINREINRQGDGEEEEESDGEGVVLLLRQRVRRREDSRAAPESQTLQVPCLPQEALHS